MVNWTHSAVPGRYLFGEQNISSWVDTIEGLDEYASLLAQFTVSTTATVFSRYTVMLERLVALAAIQESCPDSAGVLYGRLRDILSSVYGTAVLSRNPTRGPNDWDEPKPKMGAMFLWVIACK
jgi:hypothetical protein